MEPFVVGKRVEVLWKGELFAAEVVKCHRTGEYDVMYEKDGTVRTFVTREEHRLAPLEEKGEEVGAVEEEGVEEEGLLYGRVYQAGGREGRVHPTRCVRDVQDWRLHHHGCEQVAALLQARCQRVVHGARVCHQRSRTRTLLQARWEYKGCVRPSGLHHQSKRTRTLRQARWEYKRYVRPSGMHH